MSSMGSIGNRRGIRARWLGQMTIERIRDLWPVTVANRPETNNAKSSEAGAADKNKGSYHMVPTAPRNPTNSNAAARWITSSGNLASPIAVSHALRNTRDAFCNDNCIN